MFIWIPWFVCIRLLEYGLTPVSTRIIRLTVQKLILPVLPKTFPDKKILWKFRRLLHSFTAFTPSYKERNILVFSQFHPTFSLRHIPLSVSALLISNDWKILPVKYLYSQLSTAPRTWNIYPNSTHSGRILSSVYPINELCRFESYRP
jgi:hypothetical protein